MSFILHYLMITLYNNVHAIEHVSSVATNYQIIVSVGFIRIYHTQDIDGNKLHGIGFNLTTDIE